MTKTFIGLGAGVFSLLLLGDAALADSRRSHRGASGEIRRDYREVRRSRAELHKDRAGLSRSRVELRRDIRRGASPREIARGRAEIRKDAREVARSRQEFRRDHSVLRRDLGQYRYHNYRYGHNDNRGNHYGWRNNDNNRWNRGRTGWWNNDRYGR
ncbi:MAG: hypothetical protein WD688_09910 [Candidatus Binatia bacterium]